MNPFNAPDEINTTKGDLVEFKRRKYFYPYCHFAVYTCDCDADCQLNVPIDRPVGDGITVGVSVSSLDSSKYSIEEKTIRELCNYQRGCRVNNLEEAAKEKGLEPYDPDTIVKRAREYLRDDFVGYYNLLTKNCEHFATMCRYGKEFSCQVNDCFISKAMSTLWACRQTDHPSDRILEDVRLNEGKSDVEIV